VGIHAFTGDVPAIRGDGVLDRHVIDPSSAEKLEETVRYRYLSRDELVDALDPTPDQNVVDLGSGTGFYTRDIAPYVGTLHALDLQPEMHEHMRAAGLPDNVRQVTAGVADMPFADAALDAAYSTMTFHEFVDDDALAELQRVLRPNARLVVVDWSADGEGERGPPLDGRYGPDEAAAELESAGFTVESVRDRLETLFVTAKSP